MVNASERMVVLMLVSLGLGWCISLGESGSRDTAPEGVVEAAGFRMVVDGKVLWEAMPDGDGAAMRFFHGKSAIMEVVCGAKSSVVRVTNTAMTMGVELIVDGEQAVQQISAYGGETYRIQRVLQDGEGWAVEDGASAGGSKYVAKAGQSGVMFHAIKDEHRLGMEMGNGGLTVGGKVKGASVDFDGEDGAGALRMSGDLKSGVDVELTGQSKRWQWTSKR